MRKLTLIIIIMFFLTSCEITTIDDMAEDKLSSIESTSVATLPDDISSQELHSNILFSNPNINIGKEKLTWLTDDMMNYMIDTIIDSVSSYNPGPWGDYYLTLIDITEDGIPEFLHGPLVLSQVSDINYQICSLDKLKSFTNDVFNELTSNYNMFIYHYASTKIFGGNYYLNSQGEHFYTILSVYNLEQKYTEVECLYYIDDKLVIKQHNLEELGEPLDLPSYTVMLNRKKIDEIGREYIKEGIIECLYNYVQ